jgi:hypothetical protein
VVPSVAPLRLQIETNSRSILRERQRQKQVKRGVERIRRWREEETGGKIS